MVVIIHFYVDKQCGLFEVKCKNGLQCIFESYLCDKEPDCYDGSDEDEDSCKGKYSRRKEINYCNEATIIIIPELNWIRYKQIKHTEQLPSAIKILILYTL